MAWQPPSPPPSYQDAFGNPVGPQAGYEPFGTPRRRRKWPWFVAGGVLALLALIGGIVFLVLRLTTPAADAANSYLAGLAAHDYVAAAALACDGSAEAAQRAGEFLEQAGSIDGYNLTSVRLTSGFGQVSGTITLGGQALGIGLDVGHSEGIGWQVCDFSVAGLGSP